MPAPGYAPQLRRGKTEALVSLAGSKAQTVGRRLFKTGAGVVELQLAPPIPLRCVFQYKHLGTTLSAKTRPAKDLKIKLGAAKGAAAPIAKPVLRRRDVAQKCRVQLLDTLAYSRASYGVALWGELDASTRQQWQAGIAALSRCAVRPRITEHGPVFPDLLAPSLHQTAVVDALQEEAGLTDKSWWTAADEAVRWLDRLCKDCARYNAYGDADAFLEEAIHSPHKVRGHILRAKRLAAALTDDTAGPQSVAKPDCKVFQCEDCPERFATLQQVRAHAWSKHGGQTLLAALAPQHTCPACLRRFWRRPRLLRHLHHDSPSCGHFVLATAPDKRALPESTASAEEPFAGSLPAVRVPGPLRPNSPDCVSCEQLAKFSALGLTCTEEGGAFFD